ncbi:MAG: arsenate reductase (glutaredoxin) [Gammaproteobacteria bacterium]|nr:arsenate reductase (glutaredoxin) [Gammaproteobacteria bacterium]NCF82897.1 arsenate reductase (glutaredoxin) [Pseudomonadota bacterium]
MNPVTLYHNPRCSKSRQALELLLSRNVAPKVVEYLETPPSVAELERILLLLAMDPRALMRKKESVYKELGLDDKSLDRRSLIQTMVEHPILMERPIAVTSVRAALGRPPENVLDVL